MGHINLAIVHEMQQRRNIFVLEVLDDNDGVLARVTLTTTSISVLKRPPVTAHLEKLPEVGTAGGEQHLVGGQALALHPEGHVHEVLLSQQTLEGGDQLVLVVVPKQKIELLTKRYIDLTI